MEIIFKVSLKPPRLTLHCRYFILETGVLIYGKTPSDIARGRTHGRIDVGLCVISAKVVSVTLILVIIVINQFSII